MQVYSLSEANFIALCHVELLHTPQIFTLQSHNISLPKKEWLLQILTEYIRTHPDFLCINTYTSVCIYTHSLMVQPVILISVCSKINSNSSHNVQGMKNWDYCSADTVRMLESLQKCVK